MLVVRGCLPHAVVKYPSVVRQFVLVAYYGNYFKPENLNRITQDGFRDFLLLKNNRHWSGIHRQPQIYEDMDRLRECLAVLLDESRPFEKRLDVIVPKGKPPFIGGLGRAGCSRRSLCASTRTNTPFTTGSEIRYLRQRGNRILHL